MKRSKIITLGGMITALSLVLMFLSNIITTASLALPALAGLLLIVAVIEMGSKWAAVIYAAVSILSMLLMVDKTSAIFYIFFFGHYPIIKSYVERIHKKFLQWVVKVLVFNACALVAYLITEALIGFKDGGLKNTGFLLTAILFNVTFIVYDFALSRLVVTYVYKIRKRFFKSI